ncbi:unnamed protein product [Tilletia controversa]|nr:unnamed protein product [Tilletia controversa]
MPATHVDAADLTIQAIAERDTQVLARNKQDESMASFVSRALTNFRASRRLPLLPLRLQLSPRLLLKPLPVPRSPLGLTRHRKQHLRPPLQLPPLPPSFSTLATPPSPRSPTALPARLSQPSRFPAEARLVNLEDSEANINAGPHAESRDVMVAQIKNDGVSAAPVSRDLTLAQISDQADEVDEDAEDAPSQAQAQ